MAIGIVVLGAGLSKRMGEHKLTLPWKHHTVIEEVASLFGSLSGDDYGPKVAVLGPHNYNIAHLLERYGFFCVCNENPQIGQGESLRIGINTLLSLREGALEGVICATGDQPLLQRKTIEILVDTFYERTRENHKKMRETTKVSTYKRHRGCEYKDSTIVVPLYGANDVPGNPVLFGSFWFEELQCIEGDMGGRSIVRGKGHESVCYIKQPFEWAYGVHEGFDIDTKEAYQMAYAIGGKG